MMNDILIITNKEDITVDIVVDRLNQRNISYYRFNTEEIGESIDITVDIKKDDIKIFDHKKNKKFSIKEFNAVYYRRPKIATHVDGLSFSESEYSFNEHCYLLEGIYRFLENKKWLNNVYNIRKAENKIYQLIVAKEVGLKIPNSLITNNPIDAIEFIKKNEQNIFKSIKCGLIDDSNGISKILFTSRIDRNFISKIETIKKLPTYFQKEIKKDKDIRITIVDKRIFAAEIDSQISETTSVDWRKSDKILPHSLIDLPGKIKNGCLSLCQKLNLKFAAIDMIKDANGVYWFLELNPNGQWGWIEKILDVPISDSIIDYLIEEGWNV